MRASRFRLAGPLPFVQVVEPVQQVTLHLDNFRGIVGFGPQVENRRTGGAETRALIERRQEARLPVLHPVHRQSQWIVEHDVGGEVLALASQSVHHPRAERRMPGDHPPGLNQIHRRLVRNVRGVEGANERDVIDVPRQVGQCVRHPHAALAVTRKLEGAAHERAGVLDVLDLARNLVGISLAVVRIERGLGIEQIHLARPAIHEQVDHGLRLGRNVRRPGTKARNGASLVRQEILTEQVQEGGPLNAGAHVFEETPSGDRSRICEQGFDSH